MLYRGPAGLLVGRRPVSHRTPYTAEGDIRLTQRAPTQSVGDGRQLPGV